jgi:hypothetical protein
MALTYEVNKDKSVTIYNDGTIFSIQIDDPATEGYDSFATKVRAEEWAKAAVVRYAEEIELEAMAFKEANAAHEAEVERVKALEADADAMMAALEVVADSEEAN